MSKKTKPRGYWKNIDNVLAEARKIMDEHSFERLPSLRELRELGHANFVGGLQHHGGITAIREKLGQESIKPPGYWKDLDNVVTEARKIMSEHGLDVLPSSHELTELGHGDFTCGFRYHKISEIREKLGQESVKPSGYWQNLDNVMAEARKIMVEEESERIPSLSELRRLRYMGFIGALKHHGGISVIRELLGQEATIKPSGYWQNLDNMVTEARKIMAEQEFERLPSLAELRGLQYLGFVGGLKYHGGITVIREMLGQESNKPPGYWQSLDNVLTEAQVIMKKHGFESLPAFAELIKLGHRDFLGGLKHHGGITAIREMLGQDGIVKPRGYWKDIDNIVTEARKIMDEHGLDVLPSSDELSELGHGDFTCGFRYYTISEIRAKLDQKEIIKPNGYWKKFDNVVAEAENILEKHQLETLPSTHKLQRLGYASFNSAIVRYHGGFPAFRRLLADRNGILSEKEQLEGILQAYVEEN